MLFAENTRWSYLRSPLVEVICQLRFPTILSIGSTEPAQFQEELRGDFPRYTARQEQQSPRVVNGKLQQPPAITNYTFLSADNLWKVNMTKDFIALSTLRYTTWEDFAQRLDKVLALFIQVYRPAFFQRVGLRYINAISRQRLGLTDCLWDDLINSPFIGILDQPDVDEKKAIRSALDVDLDLEESRHLKLHAGPGLMGDGKTDPEAKFILDVDLSVSASQLPAQRLTVDLAALHDYAVRLFNAAVTEELREAMGPDKPL